MSIFSCEYIGFRFMQTEKALHDECAFLISRAVCYTACIPFDNSIFCFFFDVVKLATPNLFTLFFAS